MTRKAARKYLKQAGACTELSGMFRRPAHRIYGGYGKFRQKHLEEFINLLFFPAQRKLGQFFSVVSDSHTDNPGFAAAGEPGNGRLYNTQGLNPGGGNDIILLSKKNMVNVNIIALTEGGKMIEIQQVPDHLKHISNHMAFLCND